MEILATTEAFAPLFCAEENKFGKVLLSLWSPVGVVGELF